MCLRLVRQVDIDVAAALPDLGGAPERARPDPLDRRAVVDECLKDPELLGKKLVVVLRVGDSRVEDLQNRLRRAARRVDQYRTRFLDRLAADVVDDEPGI